MKFPWQSSFGLTAPNLAPSDTCDLEQDNCDDEEGGLESGI